jgi:hypothetical protein
MTKGLSVFHYRVQGYITHHTLYGGDGLRRELFFWNYMPIDEITTAELKEALRYGFGFTDFDLLPWKGKRKEPLVATLNQLVR